MHNAVLMTCCRQLVDDSTLQGSSVLSCAVEISIGALRDRVRILPVGALIAAAEVVEHCIRTRGGQFIDDAAVEGPAVEGRAVKVSVRGLNGREYHVRT